MTEPTGASRRRAPMPLAPPEPEPAHADGPGSAAAGGRDPGAGDGAAGRPSAAAGARRPGRGLPDRAAEGAGPLARVRPPGRQRPHAWATPTSARPPRPRTGCCRRRSRRCRRAGCRRARRSAARCSSCAARSRTSTRARRPAPRKFLGMIPFGDKVADYFRKYQGAQTPPRRDPAQPAQRPGRADPRQRRAQPGEAEPLDGDGSAEPVHLRRRAARREARRRRSPSSSSSTPSGPRR